MPPFWPNRLSEQEIDIRPSAYDWGVLQEEILEVLRIPKHCLDGVGYGNRHERNDDFFGSRSTFGIGTTREGAQVRIVLRADEKNVTDYECLVFHADYV